MSTCTNKCFITWIIRNLKLRQAAAVDKDDMVLAVQINSESRAYPIREMAYHHVVNDTVSGSRLCLRIERFVTPVWCGRGQSTA